MATDPRIIIDDNPMGVRQWIVVALMVFLNALDGFDVLSSAFAAPGITKEWGIERAGLGIGGMLAATNAVTAESTSKSARSVAMALYVIGYPVGGVIGGLAAQTWL